MKMMLSKDPNSDSLAIRISDPDHGGCFIPIEMNPQHHPDVQLLLAMAVGCWMSPDNILAPWQTAICGQCAWLVSFKVQRDGAYPRDHWVTIHVCRRNAFSCSVADGFNQNWLACPAFVARPEKENSNEDRG